MANDADSADGADAGGSVLDSRAYPDRPCSRAPLSAEGYFDAQHAKDLLRATQTLASYRHRPAWRRADGPRPLSAFRGGVEHAGVLRRSIGPRFVCPTGDQLPENTRVFGFVWPIGKIFIQLIVVDWTLTPAPCAVACFGFVPHLLPKRSRYLPFIPRGWCRSCSSVSPRHVAKRDRSRYPHDLSQSADPGQRTSGAVRASKAACLVRHQAARPAGDVAGARYRGGRVGGLSAAVDEGCHPPRRIAARDQVADLEAGGTRSLDRSWCRRFANTWRLLWPAIRRRGNSSKHCSKITS